jgi:hypothetical protein
MVHALDGPLGSELAELLSPAEIAATQARAEHLLARGHFPVADDDYRNFPWPLV